MAGVTFQGLVTCALLTTDEAPPGVREVVPEGYEDIDVRLDGSHVFVQVKQRSRRLPLTQLADALVRSINLLDLPSGGALRLAVVTDAFDLDGVRTDRLVENTRKRQSSRAEPRK